ncbi:MAG TPA: A24 family peptidase [Candidatus Caenarcaniphilales bacterium]|nr:A24 family peptidase [Candidatus Caenarcaniphilales bacterium]
MTPEGAPGSLSDWLPVLLGAGLGLLLGVAADRLAARWPEHEAGVRARGVDWRTFFVGATGALVFAVLVLRWPDPRDLVVLGIFSVALIVLLATDLDQKLLPDALTLPLIVFAALVLVAGWSPLLRGRELALLSGVAAAIGAPVLLFVTDYLLKGALGMGDLKLSVSIGLLAGVSGFFTGFLIASIASSVVILALIAARRIGLRTAIPFGPVLIFTAFAAMLMR